jgi:hypothetical protein
MSLLTPLGLLGLIGLIILIIIYLIKPNYQNKVISSTFVWNLSLKYRKKKLPINKLRNILLIICQVLIVTISAFILAQPFIPDEEETKSAENIVILDVSGSMLSVNQGETRIERAVARINEYALEKFKDENQKISLIVASDKAYFLVQEVTQANAQDLFDALAQVTDPSSSEKHYTYGTPDIDGAIKLAEEITSYSPDVNVTLFTDTNYIDKGRVGVVNIVEPTEWNAAILDVRATVVENKYVVEVDVASYGADKDVKVYIDIKDANVEGNVITLEAIARCSGENITTLLFSSYNEEEDKNNPNIEKPDEIITLYSYNSISVRISESDSLSYDNVYYLYGGTKPTLKVQYYSALPNNYFSSVLMVLRDQLKNRWKIEITEVGGKTLPATEGFDIYIYEHAVPDTLPIDGVVILSNPDKMPSSSGVKLGAYWMNFGMTEMEFAPEDPHPIMDGITAENIKVTMYKEVLNYGDMTPIMSCDGKPVVFVKDEVDTKMVLMSFSLNYSNLPIILEFPLFMHNIFEYFAPATLTETVYEINDTVSLNARGDKLYLQGPGVDTNFTEFPVGVTVTDPGAYTTTQVLISGEEDTANFYVKLPASESNISHTEDVLSNPFYYDVTQNNDLDLLLYFAIALVALLFIEWWLKSREQL